jgi:hypothetical protein
LCFRAEFQIQVYTPGDNIVETTSERKKIPVVVSIDVEPDDFFIDRNSQPAWNGYESIHDFLSEFRAGLASASGSAVHFSWFFRMDPQIAETYGSAMWAFIHYRDRVEKSRDQGDEIGLHTHAYRWSDDLDDWIVDHGNRDWINHCVSSSLDAFRQATGHHCESFRFGDGWLNAETLRLLEDSGVRFDLTLEPERAGRQTWHPDRHFTGSLPDWSGIPQIPYRASSADFRKSDLARTNGMWLIPVSSGRAQTVKISVWHRCKHFFHGRKNGAEQGYPILNMNQSPEIFCRYVDDLLDVRKSPYLAFMMRSDVSIRKQQFVNVQGNLDYLLSHPMIGRLSFATPAETIRLLGY